MSPRTGRTRGSLLLTTLLVAGLGVEANRLLERLPAGRVDLSEDGLYGLSPVTRRVLAQLEDTLSVHAFFTAEVESGRAAIEKARVEAQLEELRALAGRRSGVRRGSRRRNPPQRTRWCTRRRCRRHMGRRKRCRL